ncbi:RHS repeat-associated core domain-containing protein [Pseudomonas syringae]|uniref:RHS repeat-associated core domain-containing protein n=1 Tax=Pseudomonas syringae TaxID=317 RepID=UPI001F2BCBC8|nr:RHS repeat-associated core domain-containing protein [Pseudomonas syringae]
MRRKTWQYATTLPAEKLSQIQNPLIKPERYVEHAYNPLHRRYEYDPAGELSRTLDKLRGEVTYEYEANGRLLEHNPEKRFDGEEFRYDAAGNRLNFNTSRFDRVKDNRLKKWSNHEYKYDAWGNLVEKIVGIVRWQTFTYDCENRLVKTETMANSQVESTSSYQYDSLGRRVGKQWEIKGQTDQKRFLWQGLRMLREEGPEQSSLYLYEPGSYAPLARVDEKEGEVENKVYYFHTDQIGTPLEMTDAEGQIVWQAKYRPWGAIEKLVVNEVEQNLRFQGQYFDVETGLHYNTFRYYDPEIGRFITQDPIGLAGGDNLYKYVPNPTAWVDPWGWACNRPGGYKSGDVDAHGNLSPGVNRAPGNKNIPSDKSVQSHHFIQDEWAKRNVAGYKRNAAPAVLLKSSSGESHAIVSSLQRTRRRLGEFNGTIKEEFGTAYKELIDSGVSPSAAKKAASRSYKYFDSLGAFD